MSHEWGAFGDGLPSWVDSVGADVEDPWFADEILERAILPPPGTSFAEISSNAGGAWPGLVAAAMARIGRPVEGDAWPTSPPSHEREVEMHPLDFEWYFDEATGASLADQLPGRGSLVLLGAPSVANLVPATDSRDVLLIDKSPHVRRRLPGLSDHHQFRESRVGQRLPIRDESVDAVFFDAPWYLPTMFTWLVASLRAVRRGGQIQFVLFPELTRPNAKAERTDLLNRLQDLGEILVEPGVVRYQTPLFERNALQSLGLPCPGDWRRGDLVTLSAIRRHKLPGALPYEFQEDSWDTFTIGSQVVKVSQHIDHSAKQLGSLEGCPEDTLPTVSRRDARMRGVGFWTSRNRVASVNDPRQITSVLKLLSEGSNDLSRDRHPVVQRILSLLKGTQT